MRRARCNGIVVVGGHALVREGIKDLVNREPDLVVCGQAANRSEALRVIERTSTRLVITDFGLLDAHGLDLIKDIRARWPDVGVLVFSVQAEALYAERALRAGAHGYITEDEAPRKLLDAVRRILGGGIYLSESLAMELACKSVRRRSTHRQNEPVDFLSDRELEVFGCVGQGYSTQDIGRRLNLHPQTVETSRARIKEKLGLPDANQLLQHAIRWSRYSIPE